MFTYTHRERGGILLELTVTCFILVTFLAGSARLHLSFRQRFERIVRERNAAITALRH
jgi:hypothetical protein